MKLDRSTIPIRVAELLDGRPTRWVPQERLVGDYDGRDRTLEVFDAAARDQRELLRRLRVIREKVEQQIGGPLTVLFHTPGETERLYATEAHALRREFQRLSEPLPALDESAPDEVVPDSIVAQPPYEEAA
jgi:hypothetical protein